MEGFGVGVCIKGYGVGSVVGSRSMGWGGE